MTTSTFSAGAREYVRGIQKRVILLDGIAIADLMIEHGVGVARVESYHVDRLDEDYYVAPLT